jgi:nucleoside phosphorylase
VEEVEEMIAIAMQVDLLQAAWQVRCPHCSERVDRDVLLAAEQTDGEAYCPECDRRIDHPGALASEPRYRLAPEADREVRAIQQEEQAKPVMRAVLLCALLVELEALGAQLALHGPVGEQTIGGGEIFQTGAFVGEHITWELFVGCSERSNTSAATAAANAISILKPQVAVFVGVAGGIAGEVTLGDVVAASTVFDYDQGKDTAAGYEPREVQLPSTFGLRQRSTHVAAAPTVWPKRITPREENQPESIRAIVEPIAAGGKVITSSESETARLIERNAPRAVAVETEGAGFLTAIDRTPTVDGIVIRGISDMRDGKATSDRQSWQARATARATAFTFEVLYQLQPPSA